MDVAGLLIGVVGLLFGAFQFRRAEVLAKRVTNINWQDLNSACRDLRRSIERRNRPIGLVLTPGTRGGLVADLIVRGMKGPKPPILVGLTRTKADSAHPLSDFKLVSGGPVWAVYLPVVPPPADVIGDVLIVDDYVRSGDFMENCRQHLVACGYDDSRIVTAAVAVSGVASQAGRKPNHSWRQVERSDFAFPWGPAE